MKIRRQISANGRRKHFIRNGIRVQHHKMNIRRQSYFNQTVNQETTVQSKEH